MSLGRDAFDCNSMIASSTFLPQSSQLKLRTTRGHDIAIDLPQPADLAPLRGRPTIYLDQNHWSTLTKTIHQPDRVADEQERTAAEQLIELAKAREVVLPMSSAHLSETAKQADPEQRYQRALTIAQLAGGWQLRDPLDLRRFELRQALTVRYRLALPGPARARHARAGRRPLGPGRHAPRRRRRPAAASSMGHPHHQLHRRNHRRAPRRRANPHHSRPGMDSQPSALRRLLAGQPGRQGGEAQADQRMVHR